MVNAPPKALSSYFLFSKERRPLLAEENKDKKITEISKLIAAEWKTMSEEDKSKYVDQAKKDKDEYAIKLAKYKETEDWKNYEKAMKKWNDANPKNGKGSRGGKSSKSSKSKGKGKEKALKKPVRPKETQHGAPKKPSTSYFIFTSDKRPEITKNYPEKKVTEIAKMLGDEWKGISDEEKKKYQEKATKLKNVYDSEIAKWHDTPKYGEFKSKLEDYQKELRKYNKLMKSGKKTTKKKESSSDSESESESDSSSNSSSGSSSSGSGVSSD